MAYHSIDTLLTDPPLWFALLAASVLAGLAWSARWLTWGGALATAGIGFVIFGFGGGAAAVPLLAFFLSSSALSKLGKARKSAQYRIVEKGDVRDVGQVLANGSVAAALVLAHRLLGLHWTAENNRAVQLLYLAALSAVNADTWATEIGGMSGAKPRLLSNWRPVAPGTSGAISGAGTLAAMTGAVFIPLCANRLWALTQPEFLVVAWAGFLGCFLDSILGASVQAQYRDTVTGELTERAVTDGRNALRIRGIPWFNNDVVNFVASVGGGLFAWVLLHYGLHATN